MFDAHNHLHFADFADDVEVVLERATAAGVTGMVLADYDSQRRDHAAQLAQRDTVWCTAGLHPWAVNSATAHEELQRLRDVTWSNFVAVGELGLDWVRATTAEARALQAEVFREQVAIAREVDLPIVIHSVRANDRIAEILRRDGMPQRGGMVHSFWGSQEQARAFTNLDLYLSVGPQITHSQPERVAWALRTAGLSRLLVETDAPSRPVRGAGGARGEPAHLSCVVADVALILRTAQDIVAAATDHNARQLFDLA